MSISVAYNFRKFKNLFNWTPVKVEKPQPVYMSYAKEKPVLLGFEVTVSYLYHGDRKLFFQTDEERFGLVSRKSALAKANAFYSNVKAKVDAYKSKTR
ncbi:MAG TPA: hypothetical protein IAC63_04015 [Candidatus Enterousia avicola]|uniref:Uncharacterized protein n=1 Tax=Candidatus Enterousia avicola TaxID=2840787 RepID=A0A9D1MT40_9PROT|nr:hypothetical protein [Candidatus Enterousia avicola]